MKSSSCAIQSQIKYLEISKSEDWHNVAEIMVVSMGCLQSIPIPVAR